MTMEKNISLAELQETLLWQSLNRQLIDLKNKGWNIKKRDSEALKSFCFQHKIFAKIANADILDEQPLSLVSDFKNLSFVTANIPQWKNLLSVLIPQTIILDCTKALARSFDLLSKYDKQYDLTKETNKEESDDEDLYAFINQYMNLREEKHIKDFSDVVKKTHRLKSIALKKIISKLEAESAIVVSENAIVMDLSGLKKRDNVSHFQKIQEIYIEEYCRKAKKILRTGLGSDLGRYIRCNEVLTWLEKKSETKKMKRSINDFIAYELPIYKMEISLENVYLKQIQHRIMNNNVAKIDVCNTSPFFFLRHPLPLV